MTSKNNLDENEIQEIRKVFVALNTDGDSGLSLAELSQALERISGKKPDLSEVQTLMSVMDKDNDGKISWNEFVSSIASFVSKNKSSNDDIARINYNNNTNTNLSIRMNENDNNININNQKTQLHSNIANFFLQFSKSNNWKQIQARRLQISSKIQNVQSSLTEAQLIDQKKKQDALQQCRRMVSNLSNIIETLHHTVGSNDCNKAIECVKVLADTLSIMKVFHTPDVKFYLYILYIIYLLILINLF